MLSLEHFSNRFSKYIFKFHRFQSPIYLDILTSHFVEVFFFFSNAFFLNFTNNCGITSEIKSPQFCNKLFYILFASFFCRVFQLTLAKKKKKNIQHGHRLFSHSRCLLVRCQRESVRLHRKHRETYTHVFSIQVNKTYRFLWVWAILLDTYNIFIVTLEQFGIWDSGVKWT